MELFSLIHAGGIVVLLIAGALGLGVMRARNKITVRDGELTAICVFGTLMIGMWPLFLAAAFVGAVFFAIFGGLYFIGKKLGAAQDPRP